MYKFKLQMYVNQQFVPRGTYVNENKAKKNTFKQKLEYPIGSL